MGIIELLIIVLLICLIAGMLPVWPHSRDWGVYPVGGIVVVVLLIILLFWLFRRVG